MIFKGGKTLRAPRRYCVVMAIYERLPRRQKERTLVNSEQDNSTDNARDKARLRDNAHRCDDP